MRIQIGDNVSLYKSGVLPRLQHPRRTPNKRHMATDAVTPRPSSVTPGSSARPDLLARWLFIVASMIVGIVLVGGITRLTESGLSITQWQPITGTLPPLTEAQWQAEFAEYRATPEYMFEAGPAGMTLADFKFIFFWEWFHRFIGRMIGLVFALPLAYFWVRKMIPSGYKVRLVALLALGGLQGAFGWFMVRSGLSGQMTDVSHFWLSIHLLTALFTLGGLVWTALDLRRLAQMKDARPARLTGLALVAAAVLFVQLLLGAWVAGLNAGHASDTWPLMQNRIIPEYDAGEGLFRAVTHDPYLLHFLHRWWAWVAFIGILLLARHVKKLSRRPSATLNALLGAQMVLGIATVMTGVALWIAVAHQLVGALLVAAFTWAAHVSGRTA